MEIKSIRMLTKDVFIRHCQEFVGGSREPLLNIPGISAGSMELGDAVAAADSNLPPVAVDATLPPVPIRPSGSSTVFGDNYVTEGDVIAWRRAVLGDDYEDDDLA